MSYQFGHISEGVLLAGRGGLWALAAQLRAGEAAAPLPEHGWTPQASETPKAWADTEHGLSGDGWCCLGNVLADANAVNGIPLTLISLEFEPDSVSCPKMGSTVPG